jgi:hypothetical protein
LRARALRASKYLLVGAVLSIMSAWGALAVQPWVKRARPGTIAISDHPLHRAVNRWTLSTRAHDVEGQWVPNREGLVRREFFTGSVDGLALRLHRAVEWVAPAGELSDSERRTFMTSVTGVTTASARTMAELRANYVESDTVSGFPLPCITARFVFTSVPNAPTPTRVPRFLGPIETGVYLPGVGANGLHLPLMPWMPGFVPNMLIWAGVTWACVRVWKHARARKWAKVGACVKCGYRGGGAVCPECGG